MLLISSSLVDDVPGACKRVCCHQNKNSLLVVLIRYSDLSRLALRWLSSHLNRRNDGSDGYLNWNYSHLLSLVCWYSRWIHVRMRRNDCRWWTQIRNKGTWKGRQYNNQPVTKSGTVANWDRVSAMSLDCKVCRESFVYVYETRT